MRYLIRSVKYFLYLFIILSLMIAVLMALNLVESDLDKLFVNGRDSLWQIALLMAVFAAIYPRFGYTTRFVPMAGSFEELRPGAVEMMKASGYVLEKEAEGSLSFRRRSPLSRAMKMFEDRISFTHALGGWNIEGHSRDVMVIASKLRG
jgi:hypothetical protein